MTAGFRKINVSLLLILLMFLACQSSGEQGPVITLDRSSKTKLSIGGIKLGELRDAEAQDSDSSVLWGADGKVLRIRGSQLEMAGLSVLSSGDSVAKIRFLFGNPNQVLPGPRSQESTLVYGIENFELSFHLRKAKILSISLLSLLDFQF